VKVLSVKDLEGEQACAVFDWKRQEALASEVAAGNLDAVNKDKCVLVLLDPVGVDAVGNLGECDGQYFPAPAHNQSVKVPGASWVNQAGSGTQVMLVPCHLDSWVEYQLRVLK
jgi:hypothetical protein